MWRLQFIDEFFKDIKVDYKIYSENGVYYFETIDDRYMITACDLECLLLSVTKNLAWMASGLNKI